MRRWQVVQLALMALLMGACTLATNRDARESTLVQSQTARPTAAAVSPAAPTQPGAPSSPTPLTLIPVGSPLPSPVANFTLDPNMPCRLLRVYAGTDPGNTLRLRESPANSSRILILIPNDSTVIAVPTSDEVQAGGYRWVNIIYTDANGGNHIGWAARNANPGFATLTDIGDCTEG
jgi:hypothetical protein